MGFGQVSASHEVSPLIKLVPRGDTTVADAYLSPVLRRYVDRVSGALTSGADDPILLFMASSGGLKAAATFRGRDAILSGPAGGVVGMAETAKRAGFDRVIGFDMGGTSTDVAHFAGEYERSFETQIAGVRIAVPMLRVHTVAAGGGSIISYDGTRFRVGPDSAGANPGPKAYRRGGPLTVTDANVMLGKLDAQFFPRIFGPAHDRPLDAKAVRTAFTDLAREVGDGRTPEEIADGAIRIAVENMANAIKKISVERGYDVTEYALNCFGSAGGQHACLIADTLGIETVLVHPLSGLLSAYGMGLAQQRASRERSIEAPLDGATMHELENLAYELGSAATEELLDQGVEHDAIAIESFVHLRYAGTDTALPVPLSEPGFMRRDFEALHRQRFGFISPEKDIVAAAIEVAAASGGEDDGGGSIVSAPTPAMAQTTTRFYSRGAWHEAPVVLRESLMPALELDGPALVIEPHQTIVVEPGWKLALTAGNDIVMTRAVPRAARASRRRRRPGAAGGVQQPVHGHRRADGRSAPQHGAVGEHQGAAGFLLRRVRRHRRPCRQRAAPARASGLHGSLGRNDHPRARR